MTLIFSRIALRNIRRNPRRTLFTVIAISFSLFCIILFQALKEGLHREMVSGTVRLDTGSLQVHAAGYGINQTSPRALKDLPEITGILKQYGVETYAPRLKTPALVLGQENSSSVLLSGVDPGREPGVSFISQKMVGGGYLAEESDVLIGKALAHALDSGVGDDITLMARGLNGSPVIRKFRVGGIYSTSLASFDLSHVYMTLPAAGSLIGADGLVTEVAVRTDIGDVEALALHLKNGLQPGKYSVHAWDELAQDVKQLIELNDATMKILMTIVFTIVAMGIANTMTTVIFERFHEFGIMTAIGTGPSGIIRMVVLESFFLALLASAIGTAAGLTACIYFSDHGIDLTRFTSANRYLVSGHVLRTHLTAGNIIISNLVTMMTALFAGIYPAVKAALLDPVRAILHT